jgi:protein-tyrosine phosphatase
MSAFRVLFVCTANHCRSPIAEHLLTAACDDRFGAANTWIIESAGTDVEFAQRIHKHSAYVIDADRTFVEKYRSRQLDVMMLSHADLILTAGREHRAVAMRLLPAAIGRTFTILQFARLAAAVGPITSEDPGELGRQLLAEAKSARSTLQPVSPDQDDLSDPIGGPLEGFQVCAATVAEAIKTMLQPVRLVNSRSVA